jgi:2-polyprenyl-3-methyl-5-hydroxy-6-metoxy-1,4-benzoquinol methylase
MIKIRNFCPVCKNSDIKITFNISNVNINYCDQCVLYFSREILEDEIYKNYYMNEFGSDRHLQGQRINAKINLNVIRKFIYNFKELSILDFGTGYGFLPNLLKKNGVTTIDGYELSIQESNFALKENRINIIKELDLDEDEKLYDLVTTFEVIEHINDVSKFIDQVHNKIKSGGYLLIMTDNFFSNIVKRWGKNFPKWIPHSHVTHFGSNSLIKLLEDNGFVITKFGSYTPWELWAKFYIEKLKFIKFLPDKSNLENEFKNKFSLFYMRNILSPLFAKLSFKEDMNGQLIFILAKKV